MKKRILRYRAHYRRSLDERAWAPLVRLGACILCAALLFAGGYFGARALLERGDKGPLFSWLRSSPKPEVTPEPTPAPTSTPEPRKVFTGKTEKLMLSALGDLTMIEPNLTERGITFVTGEDISAPDRLYIFSFAMNKLRRVYLPFTEGQLRNPVWAKKYLAVEEIHSQGGVLRVTDLETGIWHNDTQIRYGAPALSLEHLCLRR